MIYLYIKRHTETGLKYFGKTTRPNVVKYLGSGPYWLNHIRKHGKHLVKTVKIWQFEDNEIDACTSFAVAFSIKHNIVESPLWANQIQEDGVNGFPKGGTHSEQTKLLISEKKTGSKHKHKRVYCPEELEKLRQRMRETQAKTRDKVNTEEVRHKKAQRIKNRGWTASEIEARAVKRRKRYSCVCPDGSAYEVADMNEFCKQRGWGRNEAIGLRRAAKKQNTYKGWSVTVN